MKNYQKVIYRKKRKEKNDPSIPYKKMGFWGGWNQLLAADILNYTNNAKKFKDKVCNKYNISGATFDRWRTGRIFKNKALQAAVEVAIVNDFAEFGVTENIWNIND